MMMFNLSIVTAHGIPFEGAVESIVLPGVDGQFGILANHAPLIGALLQGLAKVTTNGKEQYFMIGEGYVDVAQNEVSVIVGQAVAVKDLTTGQDLLKMQNPWEAALEMNNI